jgi:hypothetical protein
VSLVKKVEGAFGVMDLPSSQVQVLPNSMVVRSETDEFAKVAAASRVLDQLMRVQLRPAKCQGYGTPSIHVRDVNRFRITLTCGNKGSQLPTSGEFIRTL